jgi:hypothetical protein
MNLRQVILFITLVIPGLAVVGTSIYWFNLDYAELRAAETNLEKLVKEGKISDRQLEYTYHRALAHRINVFADGTWGILGGAIAGLGIHGIATIKKEK